MIRKVALIGLAVLFISAPLIVVLMRSPIVSTLLPAKNQKSDRYSVQSDVPGYTVVLADTRYLDYITANAGVFGQQAIVDSKVYRGFPGLSDRYTVSAIRFVLSTTVPETPVSIITGDGKAMPGGIIGQGGYTIENGILVVSVWLNIKSLTSSVLVRKLALDDAFVRTAVNTLYYARGLTTSATERDTLVKVTQDIEKNLYSGLFPWPFQIVVK